MDFVLNNEKKSRFNFWSEFRKLYKKKTGEDYTVDEKVKHLLNHIKTPDLKEQLYKFFELNLQDYSFLMFYYTVKYDLFDILELNPNLTLNAVRKLVKGDLTLYRLDYDYLTTLRLKLFNLTKNLEYFKAPIINSVDDYKKVVRRYEEDLERLNGNKRSHN